MPTVPGVIIPNRITTPDVDDMFGPDDGATQGRPVVVQLVTPDRKVLAEQVIGYLEGRIAFS